MQSLQNGMFIKRIFLVIITLSILLIPFSLFISQGSAQASKLKYGQGGCSKKSTIVVGVTIVSCIYQDKDKSIRAYSNIHFDRKNQKKYKATVNMKVHQLFVHNNRIWRTLSWGQGDFMINKTMYNERAIFSTKKLNAKKGQRLIMQPEVCVKKINDKGKGYCRTFRPSPMIIVGG